MTVTQASSSVGEVASLAEIKTHLRIDHTDEDVLVAEYFKAAVAWIEKTCATVLLETPFSATLSSLEFDFSNYPNAEITSLSYVDELGASVTIPASGFEIKDAQLVLLDETVGQVSSATLEFTAGFGVGNIPGPLKIACLTLCNSWFEERSDMSAAPQHSVPTGVRRMIAPYRSFGY